MEINIGSINAIDKRQPPKEFLELYRTRMKVRVPRLIKIVPVDSINYELDTSMVENSFINGAFYNTLLEKKAKIKGKENFQEKFTKETLNRKSVKTTAQVLNSLGQRVQPIESRGNKSVAYLGEVDDEIDLHLDPSYGDVEISINSRELPKEFIKDFFVPKTVNEMIVTTMTPMDIIDVITEGFNVDFTDNDNMYNCYNLLKNYRDINPEDYSILNNFLPDKKTINILNYTLQYFKKRCHHLVMI